MVGDAGVNAVSGDLFFVFWALACLCLTRAIFMMVFMRAARGRLILDGYREARRTRSAAAITGGRQPLVLTVWDQISFTTREGRHVQVRVHRLARPHVSTPPVWYSLRNPEAVSFTGPGTWSALAAAGFAVATLAGGA